MPLHPLTGRPPLTTPAPLPVTSVSPARRPSADAPWVPPAPAPPVVQKSEIFEGGTSAFDPNGFARFCLTVKQAVTSLASDLAALQRKVDECAAAPPVVHESPGVARLASLVAELAEQVDHLSRCQEERAEAEAQAAREGQRLPHAEVPHPWHRPEAEQPPPYDQPQPAGPHHHHLHHHHSDAHRAELEPRPPDSDRQSGRQRLHPDERRGEERPQPPRDHHPQAPQQQQQQQQQHHHHHHHQGHHHHHHHQGHHHHHHHHHRSEPSSPIRPDTALAAAVTEAQEAAEAARAAAETARAAAEAAAAQASKARRRNGPARALAWMSLQRSFDERLRLRGYRRLADWAVLQKTRATLSAAVGAAKPAARLASVNSRRGLAAAYRRFIQGVGALHRRRRRLEWLLQTCNTAIARRAWGRLWTLSARTRAEFDAAARAAGALLSVSACGGAARAGIVFRRPPRRRRSASTAAWMVACCRSRCRRRLLAEAFRRLLRFARRAPAMAAPAAQPPGSSETEASLAHVANSVVLVSAQLREGLCNVRESLDKMRERVSSLERRPQPRDPPAPAASPPKPASPAASPPPRQPPREPRPLRPSLRQSSPPRPLYVDTAPRRVSPLKRVSITEPRAVADAAKLSPARRRSPPLRVVTPPSPAGVERVLRRLDGGGRELDRLLQRMQTTPRRGFL